MLHALILTGKVAGRGGLVAGEPPPTGGAPSLLRAVIDELSGLVATEGILVATTQGSLDAVRRELPELPRRAILTEPCRRNTGPCIGLVAACVAQGDPQATMLVLPADHLAAPEEGFRKAVELGLSLVDDHPARVVTFGVRPTRPAEEFGYIERGEPLVRSGEPSVAPVFRVARFDPEPDADEARRYVDSGTFYWSSGIFLWKARAILDALAAHEPSLYQHLRRITDAINTPWFEDTLHVEFAAAHPLPIEYLIEKYDNGLVVEAPFAWESAPAVGRRDTPVTATPH